MKLGIVGLPNVGKSTLFNAITNAGAESANYPFCTIDPNVGTVAVPDSRLDWLSASWLNFLSAFAAFRALSMRRSAISTSAMMTSISRRRPPPRWWSLWTLRAW